jgi:hypothetical protein
MSTGDHLPAGVGVAAQAFLRHLQRRGIGRKLHETLMIGDVLPVAFLTTHRPPTHALVTSHALAMVGGLEPDPILVIGIEGLSMTGSASHRFGCFDVRRPVVVAGSAVAVQGCGMLRVHESHRTIDVLEGVHKRTLEPQIAMLDVFGSQPDPAKALLSDGKILHEDVLDEWLRLDGVLDCCGLV